MSPSHTMSAHWGKQIYTSWRQSRQGVAQQPTPATSPLPSPGATGHFGQKRSMDSDRSNGNGHGSGAGGSPDSPMSRQSSASSWFGGRRS